MADKPDRPLRPPRLQPDADAGSREEWFLGGRAAHDPIDDSTAETTPSPRLAAPGFATLGAGPRQAVRGATNWIPVGPRNIGGKVTALVIDPTDPAVIYAGTAAGGPYKTLDGGETWFPLFHEQESLSVGGVTLSAADPQRIWVATGDPRPGDRVVIRGNGIYRSDDGGSTWENTVGPLGGALDPCGGRRPYGFTFQAIAADPLDADSCWAVGAAGVFRTTDAGVTWHHFAGTEAFDWYDVVFSPPVTGAMNPLWLVRSPGRVSGGLLLRLEDPRLADPTAIEPLLVDPEDPTDPLPSSFMAFGQGHPDPVSGTPVDLDDAQRGKVAVAPSNPDRVYVRFVGPGSQHLAMFTTAQGGQSPGAPAGVGWTILPDEPSWSADGIEDIGDYALTLAVSPADEGHVATASMDLYVTRHGTNPAAAAPHPMWIRAMAWELYEVDRAHHADHHAIAFGPAAELWVGNDGGVSVSSDVFTDAPSGGQRPGYAPQVEGDSSPQRLPAPPEAPSWRKRSHGMNVSLPYSLAQSPVVPALYGCGYQDNGVFITTGSESWDFIMGADGGFIAFEPDDPYRMYVTWQGAIDHVSRPGRVEAALPTPGDVFRLSVWPRNLPRGFLQDDDALFVADTAHDPRVAGRVLHARRHRLYGLRPETAEEWQVEQAGRGIDLWVRGDDSNPTAIHVEATDGSRKLGIEPQTATSEARSPAVIRTTLPGPYQLADGDTIALSVDDVPQPITFHQRPPAPPNDPGFDLTSPVPATVLREEINRQVGAASRLRALPGWWPQRRDVDLVTEAVGPSPAASITITEVDGGARAFGLAPGVYTAAPGHPCIVRLSGTADVSNSGTDKRIGVAVGAGPAREVILAPARFAIPEQAEACELAPLLTAALAGDDVRVVPTSERRRVRVDADAGARLRFSGTGATDLGLPAQTSIGGAANVWETNRVAPDGLSLLVSDGTNEIFSNFGIAAADDLAAMTSAELHTLLEGDLCRSSLQATVTLNGNDVELSAPPGNALHLVGDAVARLGFPATIAPGAAATVSGPFDVENRTWLQVEIRDGARRATVTLDRGTFNDPWRVQHSELLRVLQAAADAAGIRARWDTEFRRPRGNPTEITFDPQRDGRVWVGGQDAELVACDRRGADWRVAAECPGARMGRSVEAIAFHPQTGDAADDAVVYVGLWGPYGDAGLPTLVTPATDPGFVFRSDDDGATWTHIGDDIAIDGNRVPVRALAVDPQEPDAVYAAGDVGVFRSADRGASWTPINENLPNARVSDLVFEPRTRTLRAALWGRSVFERRIAESPSDVVLYVRSTDHDAGDRTTIVGPDLDAAVPGIDLPSQSPDIKLLPTLPGAGPVIDGVEFDEDLVHTPPLPGTSAIAVQVHNRGPFAATQVRIVVLAADATLGPPPLPAGFAETLAAGAVDDPSGEWTVLVDTTLVGSPGSALDKVLADQPRVLAAEIDLPAEIVDWHRLGLLAIVTCPDDPFLSEETDVPRLLSADAHVAFRSTPTVRPADHARVQLVGRVRDRAAPFDITAAPVDSALMRLGVATGQAGLRTLTLAGGNPDGTFDLSGGGGPRGVTISYPDVAFTVNFARSDFGDVRFAWAFEVADVLDREFMARRLPVRARLTGPSVNETLQIEGLGVIRRAGNPPTTVHAVQVSVTGGGARTRLGIPANTFAGVLSSRAEGSGGFDLNIADRTLDLVVRMSHVVRFGAPDVADSAAVTADQIRAVFHRELGGLGWPIDAVVPRVELDVRRSVGDLDGSVTGRSVLADVAVSPTAVAANDRSALFRLPASLAADQPVTGNNHLYLRSTNDGNARQPAARHRLWVAQGLDVADGPVTLDPIGEQTADVEPGGDAIVEVPWNVSGATGDRLVVVAAVDHPDERPVEMPAEIAGLAGLHDLCRRRPGLAYREFVVA